MDTGAGWRPLRKPEAQLAHEFEASPFSRLAIAHVLSVAGDTLVTLALAGSLFFDISPSAARGRVALSLVASIAPFAVVAPFLGPAIDRVQGGRRLMLSFAASARALTSLLMAGVLNNLLLFPAAFAELVLSKTHAVTKSSLVPSVVATDDELVGANSRLALGSAVAGFVAAVPGVLVLRLAGAEWVVRLAALSYAAAAIAALRITQLRSERPRSAGEERSPALRGAGIRLAATGISVLRGAVGFLTFLIAFALRRDGAPSWVFGVVLAASMSGSFVGAVIAPRLRETMREEPMLLSALGSLAFAGLVAAWVGGRAGAAVLAGVVGVAAAAGKLAFDALVQRDAPGAAQGRQFARFEAEFQLVWVAGALIPVVLPIPLGAGFVSLGLAGLAAAGLYVTGQRAMRTGD